MAATVWVVFWSLYPTFSRPRAFFTALRAGALRSEVCSRIPTEKTRQDCWRSSNERLQQSLDAITLRNEYAGYAPVWLGAGLGVPLAGALALRARRQRRA